jgi:hypothetical protein
MMPRGRSHTKPGSLLKSQIPIRTWADWDDAVPGFVEIDLVGHEGGNSSGEFCFTLTVTDIATGWTINRSVRNKAQRWVLEALVYVSSVFPFPIRGIDSDNGSEFINEHLLRYCEQHEITFTRSRPGNKNDGAHVEQKNWARVRELVGYYRYDTAAERGQTQRDLGTGRAVHQLLPPAAEADLQATQRRESDQEIRRCDHAAPASSRSLRRAQAPDHHHERHIQTTQTSSPVPADPRPHQRAGSPRSGQGGTPLQATRQPRLERPRLAEELK